MAARANILSKGQNAQGSQGAQASRGPQGAQDSQGAKASRGSQRRTLTSFLLIVAGFTLTSTAYLSWLYHLMEFAPPGAADALTMIGGYGLQAVGIAIVAFVGRRWPGVYSRVPFLLVVALHFACAAPAALGTTFAGTLAFGYLMNVFCGMIAAYYLYTLSGWVVRERRGIVFGGGYACSIIISWLLSHVVPAGTGDVLGALLPCLLLSLFAVGVAFAPAGREAATSAQDAETAHAATTSQNANASRDGKATQNANASRNVQTARSTPFSGAAGTLDSNERMTFAFACFAVLLMSLVKNVGFSFPTADIATGVDLELSRLFYAAGLIIAGIVVDRSRRLGVICCMAALVTPFICMVLANEPLPGTVMWAIDYFFYGFFSMFRVVLFADIAEDTGRPHVSGFGLMIGRIGDAMGTAVCMTLGDSTLALVAVAALLFAATMFIAFRLGQLMFQPEPASGPAKSSEQVFEEFSVRYDLSTREREVMRLLLADRSNAEIASELFVTESTVKFHVRNLLKKTDCKNRRDLRAVYTHFVAE